MSTDSELYQKQCTKLWYKLVQMGKVNPENIGLHYTFERFFKSFTEKHNKEPLLKDAINFIRTN